MPHNFKLSIAGAHYVSKVGNQLSATPTDPNTPKVSPNGATVANTIIGAGVYKDIFVLAGGTSARNYFGDGRVVLSSTGALTYVNSGISGTNSTNITFELNGFPILLTGGVVNFTDCIIKNGTITTSNELTRIFTRTVIESWTGTIGGGGGGSTRTFTKCLIFNSNLVFSATPSNRNFTNNYIDTATVITWNSYVTELSSFTHNNFRGLLQVNGVLYELKKLKDKVTNRPDANSNVLDLATIDPTVYDRGNFAQDPEFLNIDKRDYWSVSNTSPMLFADSTGIGNIGNVKYAVVAKATDNIFANGTYSEVTATPDLTTNAADLVLNSPATVGTVTSLPFQIAPIPQAISTLNIAQLLNFNSAEPKGTIENNNIAVVDNYDFASLVALEQAGANPRRLTYEMRWSNQDAIPTLDSHWDNQGYVTAGTFSKFEHYTKPLVDTNVPNSRGNGEPDFNPTGAVGIKAKWLQFRITVRNGLGTL